MLKTIRISNFKSLSNEPVSLSNFNVLIGANASGKSNFIDAFRFVYDILKSNRLSTAIGRRLGWANVLTREKDLSNKISIEMNYDLRGMEPVRIGKKAYTPLDSEYKFEVSYRMKKYFMDSEILKTRFQLSKEEVFEGFERSRYKAQISSIFRGGTTTSMSVPKILRDSPFLQGYFSISGRFISNIITGWRFYDLDVNAARRPCIEESETFLLDDGHNMASILNRLAYPSSRMVKKRILSLMSILVPGFEDWKTEQQFDGSIGFKVREKGISKFLLPKMVSDGTIRILSILLGLLYQPSRAALICIDEPERYLHPQVLKTLVEIMRDVSEKSQIIVTTHSTELVKWLRPSEVLMMDKIDNTTRIVRAQDVEMVDKFLEEFSFDELWLRGYLKGGKIS